MRTSYLRYLHEFFFSLNIALVAKLEGNQKPNKFFSLLESGESSLRLRINTYLHMHPHSDIGGNTAFLALTLGLALCIFLLLRISSRTSLTKKLLQLAGLVSLFALPASWLYVTQFVGSTTPSANLLRGLLLPELLAATICGAVYMYGRWPLQVWGSVALLVLHFSYWDAVCFGPYFWRAPFQSLFAIAGLCSSLVWGLYISDQRRMAADKGRASA